MCLIVKHDRKFNRKVGWKFLRDIDGSYYTGFNEAKQIRITDGKFAKANTSTLHNFGMDSFSYPGGFHIFTSKKSATSAMKDIEWSSDTHVLCKVEFKEQVAYGNTRWRHILPTVVAKQCKILEVASA